MSNIEVKRITTEEETTHALSIRRTVFVEEQGLNSADEYDGFDASATHYLGLVDDEPAGTARWRRTAEGIKLERFAVLSKYRGKGVFRNLLHKVMEDVIAERKTGEKIYLYAQANVVSMYKSAGFEGVGAEFMECDIRHLAMEYNKKIEV